MTGKLRSGQGRPVAGEGSLASFHCLRKQKKEGTSAGLQTFDFPPPCDTLLLVRAAA